MGLKKWVQFSGFKKWGRELKKIQKKIKIHSKLQKCPKSFPKVSKLFWPYFGASFSDKILLPNVRWRVETSKKFKKKNKKLSRNVKFFAFRLKQRKRNNGENMQQVLLITSYQIWDIQKVKTHHKRSCQSISFVLKTDYIHSKTSCVDESACLRKQLKWHKFPFYGDRLSGKNIHGD